MAAVVLSRRVVLFLSCWAFEIGKIRAVNRSRITRTRLIVVFGRALPRQFIIISFGSGNRTLSSTPVATAQRFDDNNLLKSRAC